MKIADISMGAAKIASAHKALRLQWEGTKEHWHDANCARFEEGYLEPLEMQVREALEAIGNLAELLGRAQRECE